MEPTANHQRLVHREKIIEDSDGDGVVEYVVQRSLPIRSLWVAADLTTGETTIASPLGEVKATRLTPADIKGVRSEGGM